MRMIARGNTPEHCQQRVNQLTKDGWKQISEIKMDQTPTIDCSWVCVLEREGERKDEKRHRWNQNIHFMN